ncbi:MAG: O-antigen ligase family protein [Enhygromyxa sp.]
MPERRRPQDRSVRGLFDGIVVLLMALGAVVFIEPAPFDLLIIVLLPVALVLRRLAIPRTSSFALVCVAVFLLSNAVSLPAAHDLKVALRYAAITVYLIIAWAFVLGLAGKLGERASRQVMLGWAVGALLTTAISIAAYFNLLPLRALLVPNGRMLGFFKDPNVFGAFLVPPAVWAVARLVSLERGLRAGWALVLVVCSTGVFLSYSRGAWISLAVALLIFFLLRLGGGTTRARVMMLLAVPFAALLLAVAFERLLEVGSISEMLEHRLSRQAYDNERFATQREATEAALRSPLGIGPGQTELIFHRAAHNSYVRGFVENGYLGGLSLTALLFASLLRATWLALALKEPRLQVAMAVVAASLAAIAVESLVIDCVHWRHMWLLSALAWTPALPARDARSSSRAQLDP